MFFADGTHAANPGEFVFFRIDTELDVLNDKGITVEWSCNGTASGSISETAGGIASESTQLIDGIVKVASASKEMTDATCIFNTSDTIRAKVSLGGWATRKWTVALPASTSSPFSTLASMDYTILVNGVTDELGNTLTLNGTTASATYSGTVASQSYSGGKRYIAGSTSGGTVTGGANGYVNRVSSALTISSTASQSVDFGTSDNSNLNESGLSFAYKFTVATGATVTAGNSFSISCTESSGAYYCAVPLSHTAVTAKAVKTGCADVATTYSLRTSGSTAQQLGSMTICPAGGGTPAGTLAIVKLIKGGPLGISAFKIFLDNQAATPGEYTRAAGQHLVSEEIVPDYSLSFSDDCDAKGYVNIPIGGKATCTLTNMYTVADTSPPSPTPTPSPSPSTIPTPASLGFTGLITLGLQEGDTLSAADSSDPDIYIVNDWGYKRLFLNPVIFNFYGHLGGFINVKNVAPSTKDLLITSGLFRDCETNDPKVYGLEATGEDTGTLHWVNTSGVQAAQDDPEFFKKVFCINSNEFNWYSKGFDYTSVSQVPAYSR